MMKSKSCFVLLFFSSFLSINKLNAQAPSWLWANAMGNTGYDYSPAIASGPAGSNDVYLTGRFQGTVDADPGPGTFYLTSAGGDDIFISRIDSLGNLVWAKRMGGLNNDAGYSVALDAADNIYITGIFWGIADFDPGAGIYNLATPGSSGNFDVFISKLTPSGDFVWAKAISGTSSENVSKLSLDANGNVYTIGWFSGTIDADPGPATTSLTPAGNNDVFISKLDSSGNFIWAKHIGGIDYDYAYGIGTDAAGNVYTLGSFGGTVDFNPGAGSFNVTAVGSNDIFILKLNSLGDFIWAKTMGGTGTDYGWSMAVDSSAGGDIYITGAFEATVDFDPQIGVFNLAASGTNSSDVFISRLDSAGNLVWAKAFGGSAGSDIGFSIVVDQAGNKSIYTTGLFRGMADFDPGAGTFNLTSNGMDVFVSRLDGSGNFVWAKTAGGSNNDWGLGAALNNGNLYIGGIFNSLLISFDSWLVTNADTAGITYDLFIAKLSTIATGTTTLEPINGIAVYPNPAFNHFTITFTGNNENVKVRITDITGKFIYAAASTLQKMEVNTKDFAEGVYLVRIQTADFIETRKIIVAR